MTKWVFANSRDKTNNPTYFIKESENKLKLIKGDKNMFKIKQSKLSQVVSNMSSGMLGAVLAVTIFGGGLAVASTSTYWQNKISANELSIIAAVTQSNRVNSVAGDLQQKDHQHDNDISQLKRRVRILENQLNQTTPAPGFQTFTVNGVGPAETNNRRFETGSYRARVTVSNNSRSTFSLPGLISLSLRNSTRVCETLIVLDNGINYTKEVTFDVVDSSQSGQCAVGDLYFDLDVQTGASWSIRVSKD